MRTKQLLKLADRVFTLWALHFLVYNLWYGFNTEPINDTEVLHDTISTWVLNSVIIIHLFLVFRIIRHYVEHNMKD
jgi:hypothetical protein